VEGDLADLPGRLAEAWARLPVDLRDALGAMIVQPMEGGGEYAGWPGRLEKYRAVGDPIRHETYRPHRPKMRKFRSEIAGR
jgi:hypothetical protein